MVERANVWYAHGSLLKDKGEISGTSPSRRRRSRPPG